MTTTYLTPEEVMNRLNITRSTLYRRVSDGTLPEPLKLGHLSRFKEDEIVAAMDTLSEQRRNGSQHAEAGQ